MQFSFEAAGYHIATDPEFQYGSSVISPETQAIMPELLLQAKNKKDKQIITKLRKLVEEYPGSAQLLSYLLIAYTAHGNYKKASQVQQEMTAKHPDYLMGKLDMAALAIEKNSPEKVPALLGSHLDLRQLMPERDVFHLSEIMAYYNTAVKYIARLYQLEAAKEKLQVMMEIAPEHPLTLDANAVVTDLEQINKHRWSFDDDDINSIFTDVTCAKPLPVSQQTSPPDFHHREIHQLYHFGADIRPHIIEDILELPRETVIADLEKVLADASERYVFFYIV